MATLKRDRFVSIHAGDDGGVMLTKPIVCPPGASELHVNAATQGDGFIKVAVREGEGFRDGEWPDGWHFDQSAPFTGDSLDDIMRRNNAGSLTSFAGRTIRLHFCLENAHLYSFWFK